MLMPVPPAVGPVDGITPVTAGTATYVNLFGPVAVPFGVVTITSTAPVVTLDGVTAMIDVIFSTRIPVAGVPPIVTVVTPIRSVPVMLTPVPPIVGPRDGVTPVTVGSDTYVYAFNPVAVPFGVTTVTLTVPAVA